LLGYPNKEEASALDLHNSELAQYGVEFRQNQIPEKFKKHGSNCIHLLQSMLAWDPKVRIYEQRLDLFRKESQSTKLWCILTFMNNQGQFIPKI